MVVLVSVAIAAFSHFMITWVHNYSLFSNTLAANCSYHLIQLWVYHVMSQLIVYIIMHVSRLNLRCEV